MYYWHFQQPCFSLFCVLFCCPVQCLSGFEYLLSEVSLKATLGETLCCPTCLSCQDPERSHGRLRILAGITALSSERLVVLLSPASPCLSQPPHCSRWATGPFSSPQRAAAAWRNMINHPVPRSTVLPTHTWERRGLALARLMNANRPGAKGGRAYLPSRAVCHLASCATSLPDRPVAAAANFYVSRTPDVL